MGVSERRTCAALGQHRSTQRKVPRGQDYEARLTALEAENARLRRAVSDLTLDKQILAEAARGNF